MKNCPTCGQPILPSMGEAIAKKVDQTKAQIYNIRLIQQPPAALTLYIRNSTVSLRAETIPRGYKAQHVYTENGKRYRLRLLIQGFPRKGTVGGKLTIVALGENRIVTTHSLPEQVSQYPNSPFSHDWQHIMVNLGEIIPIRITLTTV